MPRTISLQVPPNAEAGDALTIVIEGNELEIPVPDGSQPGDVLEIQVNTEEDGEKKDEDGSNKIIELSNGKSLRFATVLPANSMKSRPADASQKDTIDDGTYGHAWPAGLCLSKFWGTRKARQLMQTLFNVESKDETQESNSSELDNPLKVLELGSGLGIVGISFAAHYSDFSGSHLPPVVKVVCTDVPDGMALLEHNVKTNASLLQNQLAQARPLLWTVKPSTDRDMERENYNLILASDVLYNAETIPALVATLKRYLSATSSLLIAVRWRKPEKERLFFESLDSWQGLQWNLVHTLNCHLSWKEYGNPNCEASNLYFHQTMISVQEKPHSLADILKQGIDGDQQLQEQMTDQEAEAFENCHIQIYCLSSKKVGQVNGENENENRKRPRES